MRITADNITDDQIRSLLEHPDNTLDFDAACRTALGGLRWYHWTVETARIECARVYCNRYSDEMFRGSFEEPVEQDGVLYLFNTSLDQVDPFISHNPLTSMGQVAQPWVSATYGVSYTISLSEAARILNWKYFQ